jgi:hypothetical protein
MPVANEVLCGIALVWFPDDVWIETHSYIQCGIIT